MWSQNISDCSIAFYVACTGIAKLSANLFSYCSNFRKFYAVFLKLAKVGLLKVPVLVKHVYPHISCPEKKNNQIISWIA